MILDGDVRDEVTCSSFLFFPSLLPSDLCMKYLLCLVIYKKFLYPLEFKTFRFLPSSNGYEQIVFFPSELCKLMIPAANLEPQILGFHFDDRNGFPVGALCRWIGIPFWRLFDLAILMATGWRCSYNH